jgi:hypothetical protein
MSGSILDIKGMIKGDDGVTGSVWRHGTGVPSDSLGSNGDFYVNDSNADVYFKASGTYSVALNIKGETGETGATGAAGPSLVTDTQANRPEGTDGQVFVPSDGLGYTAVKDTTWKVKPQFGAMIAVTDPPAAASLTKAGGGAETTLVDEGDGLLMTQMGTGGAAGGFVAFLAAVPGDGTNFALTVGMEILGRYPRAVRFIGICATSGTTAASDWIMTFPIYGAADTASLELYQYYHPFATYESAPYNFPLMEPLNRGRFFMRYRDDATNRYLEVSADGTHWTRRYSVGRTTKFTATHVGLFIGSTTANMLTTDVISQARIFHWTLA